MVAEAGKSAKGEVAGGGLTSPSGSAIMVNTDTGCEIGAPFVQEQNITVVKPDRARSKRDSFKRLAERRTEAILEKLRVLGNLANRSVYDYSDEDVQKIFEALEQELRVVRGKFRTTERRRFRLD